LLDTINPGQVFLNFEDNALFNFLRTGTRINDTHLNTVKCYIRKNFLFDAEAEDQSSDNQHQHQQVGGDVILRHPANGTVH
jgi:hypothetical protein